MAKMTIEEMYENNADFTMYIDRMCKHNRYTVKKALSTALAKLKYLDILDSTKDKVEKEEIEDGNESE